MSISLYKKHTFNSLAAAKLYRTANFSLHDGDLSPDIPTTESFLRSVLFDLDALQCYSLETLDYLEEQGRQYLSGDLYTTFIECNILLKYISS